MNKSDRDLAKQVDKDHEELRAVVDRLSTLFDVRIEPDGFVGWKLDLLWQLRDFQNQLQKHFDLEEDGGYNADLIRIAPRLSSQIAELERDHRRIIVDLNQILGDIKKIENMRSPLLPGVKERVHTLLEFIREHESRENAIIQEAYYQDHGVGD